MGLAIPTWDVFRSGNCRQTADREKWRDRRSARRPRIIQDEWTPRSWRRTKCRTPCRRPEDFVTSRRYPLSSCPRRSLAVWPLPPNGNTLPTFIVTYCPRPRNSCGRRIKRYDEKIIVKIKRAKLIDNGMFLI